MSHEPRYFTKFGSLVVCSGLSIAVLAIYWQTTGFEFVNWDDDVYVYANPQIMNGLTSENVVRAFTTFHGHLWHPIATLSHLVDVELYGLKAGGHHLTSVLIHMAASVLLFFALKHLTSSPVASAIAAGVFALHPLRVESVAWIAERKDVLTGLFLSATLLAYSHYVRTPTIGRYLLVGLAFVLGSLSKPTFVTVPFVLLLLDYWPLRRDEKDSTADSTSRLWLRLVIEKIPLMVFSAIVSLVTLQAQRPIAVVNLEQLSIGERVANAGRSYWIYLTQFFWPADLAGFYPYPRRSLEFYFQGIGAWCLILLLTGIVLYFLKTHRYLAVGWFWYLGMLFPLIGLVQAGAQSHADRFTYLPQIGIALAISWGLTEWARPKPGYSTFLTAAVLAVLGCLAFTAYRQTKIWRDGVTLFSHASESQLPSETIFNNLGIALHLQGREAEATEMYRRALQVNPEYSLAVINLGDSLRTLGQLNIAIPILKRASELAPDNFDVANNLGSSLIQVGRYDEAIDCLEATTNRHPTKAPSFVNLGLARFRQGKIDEAILDYRKALSLDPQLPSAYSNLAIALAQKESRTEAVAAFRESIRLRPDDVETLMSAAWVVATDPSASAASKQDSLDWAKQGVDKSGGHNPMFLMMLAASYATNNRFDEAIAIAKQAMDLAAKQGNNQLIDVIRTHSELYRKGQPVR